MPFDPPSLPSAPNPASLYTAGDLLLLVPGWTDLSVTRRRDLVSYLGTVASMAGVPPGSLLLTPETLRRMVRDRTAMSYGMAKGTFATILSGLRFILRRVGVIDVSGIPFLPEWQRARELLPVRKDVALTGIGRFASSLGITPDRLGLDTIDAFEAYLTERTLTGNPAKAAGAARTAWNRACTRIPDWPGKPLPPRAPLNPHILPRAAFTESFQASLTAFGKDMTAESLDRVDAEGLDEEMTPLNRRDAVRPITAALREDHARWAASYLVASGVPVGEINTIADLVTPITRARATIRFIFELKGREPSAAGMHVAEVLRIIVAKHLNRPADAERIKVWRKSVRLRYRGMTKHNRKTITDIIQPGRVELLLSLPAALMDVACELRPTAPAQARSLALRATTIGLLTQIPLRLKNLAGLRLDLHLHRPDLRNEAISHVIIPGEAMKNGKPYTMPVAPRTASLIAEWIKLFRPDTGHGPAYLFPGEGAKGKTLCHQAIRDAISDTVHEHVGVRLTPHQFRHLAARLFLEKFPGHYEEVRQLLGHESVVTTTRSYAGTECEANARRYYEDVLEAPRTAPPQPGKSLPGKPRKSRSEKR